MAIRKSDSVYSVDPFDSIDPSKIIDPAQAFATQRAAEMPVDVAQGMSAQIASKGRAESAMQNAMNLEDKRIIQDTFQRFADRNHAAAMQRNAEKHDIAMEKLRNSLATARETDRRTWETNFAQAKANLGSLSKDVEGMYDGKYFVTPYQKMIQQVQIYDSMANEALMGSFVGALLNPEVRDRLLRSEPGAGEAMDWDPNQPQMIPGQPSPQPTGGQGILPFPGGGNVPPGMAGDIRTGMPKPFGAQGGPNPYKPLAQGSVTDIVDEFVGKADPRATAKYYNDLGDGYQRTIDYASQADPRYAFGPVASEVLWNSAGYLTGLDGVINSISAYDQSNAGAVLQDTLRRLQKGYSGEQINHPSQLPEVTGAMAAHGVRFLRDVQGELQNVLQANREDPNRNMIDPQDRAAMEQTYGQVSHILDNYDATQGLGLAKQRVTANLAQRNNWAQRMRGGNLQDSLGVYREIIQQRNELMNRILQFDTTAYSKTLMRGRAEAQSALRKASTKYLRLWSDGRFDEANAVIDEEVRPILQKAMTSLDEMGAQMRGEPMPQSSPQPQPPPKWEPQIAD